MIHRLSKNYSPGDQGRIVYTKKQEAEIRERLRDKDHI
jgi:hypothetical protein